MSRSVFPALAEERHQQEPEQPSRLILLRTLDAQFHVFLAGPRLGAIVPKSRSHHGRLKPKFVVDLDGMMHAVHYRRDEEPA